MTGSIQNLAAAELGDAVAGQVILPGGDGYDAARSLWNAMADRRPSIIVRCASKADVTAAIRYARDHDLEIGVRCGGHSVIGHAVPADGLMIDLRGMDEVRVDPAGRAPGSRVGRCWACWTERPSRTGSPRPPATSPTPASAG